MLRRLMRRRVTTLPVRSRYSTASALAVAEEIEDRADAYGMEYGAGPSRIPYQPPVLPKHVAPGTKHGISPNQYLPDGVVLAPASSLLSARLLRQRLLNVSPGHYVDLETFSGAVMDRPARARMKRRVAPKHRPVSALSKLELHVLVHHLVRADQPVLAATLIKKVISAGLSKAPKRRRLLASRTIETLLSIYPCIDHGGMPVSIPPPDASAVTTTHSTTFTQNKQLAATSAAPLDHPTRALLSLLWGMQEVRHQRSPVMYRLLIKQCILQHRPDVAAKVFVGLVEEWVTEGRVAEGADVEEFYPGGGPKRALGIQLVSDQMATWWQGVRTWKLPGEVLSPHGRLDLWHPRNLSLGEKMKGFPMPVPTSPPSMVPAPDNDLLAQIIHSLHINPDSCTSEQFTASMRALAYLANTVLSRTLPLSSLRALFTAMSATKHRPAVYPEAIDIDKVAESDRWAYESFTQIHLALQSLLSAPPMSASSIAYANQVERAQQGAPDVPVHPPPPPSPYMLRPLSWTSCLQLLQYGMSRLRSPDMVRKLVVYMKQIFGEGHSSPKAHNVMLEGAIRLRDGRLAQMVSKTLFGPMVSDPPESSSSDTKVPQLGGNEIVPVPHDTLAIDHPDSRLEPEANERSLTALVVHLTVTSRFTELETLIHDLLPRLSSTAPTQDPDSASPEHLPLALYAVIIEGLRKSGKTGLATRVYRLALRAEADAVRRYDQLSVNAQRHSPSPRLPIELFTSMIGVWAGAARYFKGKDQWVRGPSDGTIRRIIKKSEASPLLAWRTYNEARQRWLQHEVNDSPRPGAILYGALFKACHGRWRLDDPVWHSKEAQDELETVVSEMRSFGLVPPYKVAKKLGIELPASDDKSADFVREQDPAITLARTISQEEQRWEELDRNMQSRSIESSSSHTSL